MSEGCRKFGISRSRFYELRNRYRCYGKAGLLAEPCPPARPRRRLSPALTDAVVGYAVEHSTAGRARLPRRWR